MEKNDKAFNLKFNLPDHYDLNENVNKNTFKLVTAPAHNFLNSSLQKPMHLLI